jgi:hypothetical protein
MERFFSSSKFPDGLYVPPGLSLKLCRDTFQGIKGPEREADHSTTSSVEVKKD